MSDPIPPQNPYGTPPSYGYYGSPPPYQQAWPVQQQQWAPLQPFGEVVPSYALASPWSRLGAALINTVLMFVTLFVGYLVWTMVLWNEGTNPGKKMLGMRVVKSDTGRVCTFGDMLLRNFVFGFLVMGVVGTFTLYIGYFVDYFMIFGERRQRLIDKMSSTLVVNV